MGVHNRAMLHFERGVEIDPRDANAQRVLEYAVAREKLFRKVHGRGSPMAPRRKMRTDLEQD